MSKFYKIMLLLFILSGFTTAQNEERQIDLGDIGQKNQFTVENITISKGLNSNYINDVFQDYNGFLWVASNNGLQKFNGYEFTSYIPDSSFSGLHRVFGFYEDKNKNLWIQTETGICRYRRDFDDFVKYHFITNEYDTVSYKINGIAEDLSGELYVWIEARGLFKINFETQSFIYLKYVNNQIQAFFRSMILKQGSTEGDYETWITFPPENYGLKLKYKFVVKREKGMLEWESISNPANPDKDYRELILKGDTLILPKVSFNSQTHSNHKNIRVSTGSELKPTHVKFRIGVNNKINPLSENDAFQIRGDIPPLRWNENESVKCLIFDSENKLWIGTDNSGLFRFDLENGNYKNFNANPDVTGKLTTNSINTALRDQKGDLWFGTDHGISRYDPDNNEFENYFPDPSNIHSILNKVDKMRDDGNDHIWTLSYPVKGGVNCFNKDINQFTSYSKSLQNWLWFSSVFRDRSGIVWLGSMFRGLHKLKTVNEKFSTYSVKINDIDVFEGKTIISVYEDNSGEIWIGGSLDGLYIYNRQTGKNRVYKANPNHPDSLISNHILDIFQDKKGIVWISTPAGLNQFNPETGRFKHITSNTETNSELKRVSKIYEDNNGMMWLVSRNGFLIQYNSENDQFQTYSAYENSDIDRQIQFIDIEKDTKGFLWIAAYNSGLLKFDLNLKKMLIVDKLKKVNITSFHLDSNGILWCGAHGLGLIRYDTKTDTKTLIGERDGLLSNSIMGLEQDLSGNLWLSTQKGLSKYNPHTGTFKHYFKEDGFFTNEFGYRAYFRCNSGEMIFGSTHGVVIFHPDSIKESKYIPPIVITDLKIQNNHVTIGNDSPLKKHISVSDEITLNYDQNDLTISFAALDYNHPERIQYSFYLENFEDKWRPPGLERTAYYTNIDPGEYIFKVKGTNSDGIWNEEDVNLRIIITPPIWKTWWAYAGYILVFLGIILGLRRYELNRQKLKNNWELKQKEAEQYQEMDRLKSRFFSNISHEFRTPLTLIKGPVQQMLSGDYKGNTKKQYNIILRNTNRLMQLINQILDLSKFESGQMNLRTTLLNIIPLLSGLTQSFESLAVQKNITLNFQTYESDIPIYIDQNKIEKIIINLLSNAFKFTPDGGEIILDCRLRNADCNIGQESKIQNPKSKLLELMISNTGSGIPPDRLDKIFDRFYQVDDSTGRKHEGTGIGLALTKELVEIHHGKIQVASEPGKTTTFTIDLPLGNEHLLPEEIEELSTEIHSETKTDVFFTDPTLFPEFQEEPSAGYRDEGSPTLLIVEDNSDMREYMRSCLEADFHILESEDGEDGIQQALENPPDIIISDVMMPKMDGFQFCVEIKTDERTSHIPVILLTAKAAGESKIEGLETGADDYLTKPFDKQELLVRLNNLIKQRKQLREKFRKEITVQPGDITVTSIDEQLLQRAINSVENHISDPKFDTTAMSREVGVSRALLHQKLKALTGHSTGEFIRTLRLKRAAQLLKQRTGNVSEIAYDVGFQSLSYFAKTFRTQFGKTPSQYVSD